MQNASWVKIKPILWQTLLIALIALIGWFAVRMVLSAIKEKMDSIQRLSVTQEHRAKQLERLPELEKQHGLIEARAKEMDIVLAKDRLVDFIEELEAMALANEVLIEIESRDNTFLESKVTAVTEKKTTGKSAVVPDKTDDDSVSPKKGSTKESGIIAELPIKKYLKLTITLTGDYQSIIRYLYQLETMPFALDIISLHMKEHPEDGDLVPPASGALNPFGQTPQVFSTNLLQPLRLDATFETVIYMTD